MDSHPVKLPYPSAKVDVIGAGGIGICLAVALARAGFQPLLVEKDPIKLEQGLGGGVGIQGMEPLKLPLVSFFEWSPNPTRPIFLCTKGYRNQEVLAKIPDEAIVIPVQNGYDPDLVSRVNHLECIASWISECPKDQTLTRITRTGPLYIGPARGDSASIPLAKAWFQSLSKPLQTLRIPAKLVDDIRPYKASKLIYNAAIGPIASGAGIDNGALLTDPKPRKLFFGLLAENIAIHRHRNIPLGKVGPFTPVQVAWILNQSWVRAPLARWFAPSLRGTYCSMAGDFATGITELDHYNGHLVRLAGDFPCPMNRAIVEVAGQWLDQRKAPHPSFLEVLERAVGRSA